MPSTANVILGPGDDAAVVAAADGRVVATTDLMVEGRHFRRDWSTAYDVGRKAAAANLADVVAMGAHPTAILVGLATPGDLPVEWVDGLTAGLTDECALVGAALVGGDIVGTDTLTVAVTALGDLAGRPPVTRSGARPGDRVRLLGEPGRAAGGLAQLLAGDLDGSMVDAHRRPQPDYVDALRLVGTGAVTAMIDLSDGLVADLGHVVAASGVRVELVASRLPVGADLQAAAVALGVDVFEWVLGGGDDHCFVVIVDPAATVASGIDIGEVSALGPDENPEVRVVDRSRPVRAGHEHFRP